VLTLRPTRSHAERISIVLLTLAGLVAIGASEARSQNGFFNTRSVGGISINTDGVLENARADLLDDLSRARKQALQQAPGELGKSVEFRKVSLRGLEAAIEKHLQQNQAVPAHIGCLAGLLQIRYVFVDPAQRDIILAGPGEGWTVDRRGFIVGRSTGRPVLLLDDLVVALRAARQARDGSISCSIDPTADGLASLRQHVSGLRTIGNPRSTANGIENALGPQRITVDGVSPTSHFARVLVGADYRMKRIAMDFEPSPVRGLPSFLKLVKPAARGMDDMLPRWWLEPHYEAILRDEEGLAWELRGSGIKAMTESDFYAASGRLERTGKADTAAQRWADAMTAASAELAVVEPLFGQLRNCMDVAVIARLIVREGLLEKAGCALPTLLESPALAPNSFPAPKQVASKASLAKKGSNWVISVSGGVKIVPAEILKRARVEAQIKARKTEAQTGRHDDWCWN